ncbi:MAG: FoF1 ATP synthase subunit a [Clostridia bacterium]
MNPETLILAAVGALLVITGSVLRTKLKKLPPIPEDADKKTIKNLKWKKRLPNIMFWAGVWLASAEIITLIFGAPEKKFDVQIFAPMTTIFGLTFSSSVVTGFYIVAAITLIAILFRIFVFPRFKDKPRGLQNVIEIAVEQLAKYCEGNLSKNLGENLSAYLFSVAAYMIGCAAVELLGLRAPTSDITMTFALALLTFILINYYGIKKKGLKGRIKSMAQPTAIIFPIKVLTDIALPVSLACRLFGNMLGGMIVIELLYFALGNFAFGIPAVLGLYFNVFHPLIQAFIFITLSLTFINEAIE